MNSIRNITLTSVPSLSLLFAALPAQAHHFMDGNTPNTAFEGFLSGIAHPLIGLDHFAFVLIVGLLVFSLKGPLRFLAPLAFVAAASGGTGLHLASADLPLSEIVIALSVILGGIAVATRTSLSSLILVAGMAGFGLFHGYAYGETIIGAETGPLVLYMLGFSVIQYGVILGIVLGMDQLAKRSSRLENITARSAGALATLVGGVFLVMNFS